MRRSGLGLAALAAVAAALCCVVSVRGDDDDGDDSLNLEEGIIGSMNIDLTFASLSVTGKMEGFQKLKGVGSSTDKIPKADRDYVPETSTGAGQCFHGTRRQLLARSSCQTCSIMVSYMYMSLFQHMYETAGTSAHPRLAARLKHNSKFSEADYELNKELFDETLLPSGKFAIVETKKLQDLRKALMTSHVQQEVTRELCYSGTGTTVWGRRFWEGRSETCSEGGSPGCFMGGDYCAAAVKGMMDRFIDRRLHLFVERSCHYQQDGVSKVALPLQCQVRTLCSCLQRCPEGGTTSDQGCEDSCKCKAAASEGLMPQDVTMYKKLQWVIDMSRNAGISNLPHGDSWDNEVAAAKARYEELLADLKRVEEAYKTVKAKMPTTGAPEKIIRRTTDVSTTKPIIKKMGGKVYSCSLVGSGESAFPGHADSPVSLSGTMTPTIAADGVYPEDEGQDSCLRTGSCTPLKASASLTYKMVCKYAVEETVQLGATVDEMEVGVGGLPPLDGKLPKWPADVEVPKIDPPKDVTLSINARPGCSKEGSTPNKMVYTEDLDDLEKKGKDPVEFLKDFVLETRARIQAFVDDSEAWRKSSKEAIVQVYKTLSSNRAVLGQARQILERTTKDITEAKDSQSDSAEDAAADALAEDFSNALQKAEEELGEFAQQVLVGKETRLSPTQLVA